MSDISFIGKLRRNRRWLFRGSLALNLFLIGLACAPLFHAHEPAPPPEGPAHFVNHMAKRLPEQDAEALRTLYDQQKQTAENNREAFHKTMDKLRGVLSENEIDENKLNAVLDEMRTNGAAMHEDMILFIQNAAKSLSPDGRKQLVPPERSFQDHKRGEELENSHGMRRPDGHDRPPMSHDKDDFKPLAPDDGNGPPLPPPHQAP